MNASRSAGLARRVLSRLLVLLLLVGLGPLATTTVSAATGPIGTACPQGQVPNPGFTDIRGHAYEAEIACVAAYGVVRGTTSTTYTPAGTVSRAQLATYLAGLLRASGGTRPTTLPNAFDDDQGSAHEANINWLASLGIVRGYGGREYRPVGQVTRAQVASYLNQTIDAITGAPLLVRRDHFVDDDGSVHQANINALAEVGIVDGIGASYDPSGGLLRGVMAANVARTIDLLVVRGYTVAPFGFPALAITPTSAASLSVSTGATSDRGARSYTVQVPIGMSPVTIAVLPAADVTVGAGVPRFASATVVPANAGTSIEVVNGAAVTAAAVGRGTTQVRGVTPVAGRITFSIDSVSRRDIVPIVYHDRVQPSLGQLDLVAGSGPRASAEPVVVGGRTTWTPTEPTFGIDLSAGIVREVSLANRTYTLDLGGDAAPEVLLRWSVGDTFRYTATGASTISRSQFETWLSIGDRVDPSAYRPGSMTHAIAGDVPLAPTGVTATSAGTGIVSVVFVKPSSPVAGLAASSYRLQRASVSGSAVGAYTEVAAMAANLGSSFTDVPPAPGTCAYRVVARSVTGDSPASSAAQVGIVAQAPATLASSVVDNGTSGQAGANGRLDVGDRLVLVFDRPVSLAAGWQVGLLDGTGATGVVDASRATAALSGPGNTTLTLTLTAVPAGTGAGLAIGTGGFLQVATASGIASTVGGWNLPRSGIDAAPYGNSRVLVGRALTPPAPSGHLRAAGTAVQLGRDEVQSLAATGNTAGTFQLRFQDQNTAAVAFNATAADIQTRLEGLAAIGVGGVTVTPAGAWSTLDVGPMTITFTGSLAATDVPAVGIAEGSSLTGGAAASVTTLVPGASVSGVSAGDTITVHDSDGRPLGVALAGPNGRTVVELGVANPVIVGRTYYVVVTRAGVPLRSRTTVLVA